MISVISAARAVKLGETDIAAVGGMENMSRAPFASTSARFGLRFGHDRLIDLMIHDGLWDVYNDCHMASCVEAVAKSEGITRKAQDDYATRSYTRARQAAADGTTAREIASIEIEEKGKKVLFSEDESPKVFNEAKMRSMKPSFDPEGTITAGNASSLNDGAAALILASERAVNSRGLLPVARIVSWGFCALSPSRFALAPPIAAQNALNAAGLRVEDVDCWEINEAFAAVPLLSLRALRIDIEKMNIFGGAIAIGHPIGASGARIIATLVNVLSEKKARFGLAAVCIGGGESTALIIERL